MQTRFHIFYACSCVVVLRVRVLWACGKSGQSVILLIIPYYSGRHPQTWMTFIATLATERAAVSFCLLTLVWFMKCVFTLMLVLFWTCSKNDYIVSSYVGTHNLCGFVVYSMHLLTKCLWPWFVCCLMPNILLNWLKHQPHSLLASNQTMCILCLPSKKSVWETTKNMSHASDFPTTGCKSFSCYFKWLFLTNKQICSFWSR